MPKTRQNATKTRVATLAFPALLLVAAVVSECNNAAPPRPVASSREPGKSTASSGPNRSNVNERAIAGVWNVPLTRPDGSKFQLSDFKGKVVVVDFWATYCPPCKKQAPELARLSKAFRDKGVEVVGLSLNEQKDQAEVLDFIKSVGMTYNVAYAGERVSAAFLTGTEDETGLPPIPQLFIFGKDGSLVEYLVGYNDSHGLPFLERVVSEQLSR